MTPDENVLGAATVSDRVVEWLRERIMSGEFEPGQKLNEADLAQTLKISRSPIREAIQRLAKEGLVTTSSYRGATVTRFDTAATLHLYEVREALEGMAARLAALRASESQIQELDSLLDEIRSRVTQAETGPYPWDHDFHLMVARFAANTHLERLVIELNSQIRLARSISGSYHSRALEACQEHERLVAAIADHDPDRAESRMREHIRASMAHTVEVLESPSVQETEGPAA